jgi:hypothetical protein
MLARTSYGSDYVLYQIKLTITNKKNVIPMFFGEKTRLSSFGTPQFLLDAFSTKLHQTIFLHEIYHFFKFKIARFFSFKIQSIDGFVVQI